jgi:hypothetical protein
MVTRWSRVDGADPLVVVSTSLAERSSDGDSVVGGSSLPIHRLA